MSVLTLLQEDKKKEIRLSVESVYSSNSRLNLLSKRKRMVPVGVDMSSHSLGKGDRYVTQRVLSAKTHRVKQLQNQLADAHYHLQELSNENRVLRAMQKKQEIALQRYENSNAELPQVLNSHNEEMRVQQTRYKQLRAQHKETTMRLKERDLQLQQLRDEHQHLLELTKDKNLLEREKLQSQVAELTAKVQEQNETISTLQRRIALEAKNFKHRLQCEINKHKDTRHDLDMAISNADKLSTIIEMKEKMLSTAASRVVKSPVKSSSAMNLSRPMSKANKPPEANTNTLRSNEERTNVDALTKLCENSRSVSSALSNDDETSSSAEPMNRYARSRTNSLSTRSTPNQNRKSSKVSEDVGEISKTVQEGMADLAIGDEDNPLLNCSPDEIQQKMEVLKADLLKKIKNNDEPISRRNSAMRRKSTEESIEEQIEIDEEVERPVSRGRRNSNVSFYERITVEETNSVAIHDFSGDVERKPKREMSGKEKKSPGKPIETYCKDIMQDLEKSSRVIDKHIKQFNNTKLESDKLVQQLFAVDKINDLVNSNGEIPDEALTELNNNFKILTNQVIDAAPVARKRSVSGRKNPRIESRTNLLGDSNLTNQDLLDDLLGKK
ncbi:lebercilin-like protein [Battus philenor]|uniref:lebercilin-like protein n=1 Tax=Battus philenor TaxID=42288 RepID=UPI0035CEFBC3